MALTAGVKLGPYEILAPLGKGGMGEVYRARDRKLNREVALKVLPEAFAGDPKRLARFQREAQVLASLNHPNIAAIYGLEESSGVPALVMELVDGPTLAERLAQTKPLTRQASGGPPSPRSGRGKDSEESRFPPPERVIDSPASRLPSPRSGRGAGGEESPALQIDDALHIARQMAEALEYAHDKGIIHRDLKPANVKITPEGAVKVLDFGLAKALDPSVAAISSSPLQTPALQDSATLATLATQAGMIMGTAAYMSPEQARGKPVDRRTDIWAFGCVLYEMLAGKQPFGGETVSDVLAAVITRDPEWNALNESVSAPVRRLLGRCLDKDPKRRLRDIGEARIVIEEAMELGSGLVPAQSDVGADSVRPGAEGAGRAPLPAEDRRSALRRVLPWAVAGVFAVAAAAVYFVLGTREQPPRMQFAIPLESPATGLALSADGKMLAYVARDETSGASVIYFERLGAAQITRLAGTEGASYPFWSPDDQSIGFFANGELRRVSVSGASPQVLARASHGRGGAWGSRDVIIYAPDTGGPLWRVNADGSGARSLTSKSFLPGESSHRWPVFLPDGDHFLFLSTAFGTAATQEAKDGIYRSALSDQGKQFVVAENANFSYADGQLYFGNVRHDLTAIPFNANKGKVTGEPREIAENVSFEPSVVYGLFGAGGKDTLVYGTGIGGDYSAMTWFDRSGKEIGELTGPAIQANPTLSPNGHRAVMDIDDPKSGAVNVWIEALVHHTASRFTFDKSEDAAGIWSSDGRTIAYRANLANGAGAIELKSTSGLEPPRQILMTVPADDILPNSWSRDDRSILCTYESGGGGSNLRLLNVATRQLGPFVAGQANEMNGMISPDGKWAAYASNETGTWEIYVTSFPAAQGKWQVSRGGGTEPRWEADGKLLYYIDSKETLTAVPVSTQPTFSAGTPTPLFALHGRAPISNTDIFTYDVSRDGKRFLVNRYTAPDHVTPLTVVLNAMAGMK